MVQRPTVKLNIFYGMICDPHGCEAEVLIFYGAMGMRDWC